jgi:hypothetical protein
MYTHGFCFHASSQEPSPVLWLLSVVSSGDTYSCITLSPMVSSDRPAALTRPCWRHPIHQWAILLGPLPSPVLVGDAEAVHGKVPPTRQAEGALRLGFRAVVQRRLTRVDRSAVAALAAPGPTVQEYISTNQEMTFAASSGGQLVRARSASQSTHPGVGVVHAKGNGQGSAEHSSYGLRGVDGRRHPSETVLVRHLLSGHHVRSAESRGKGEEVSRVTPVKTEGREGS